MQWAILLCHAVRFQKVSDDEQYRSKHKKYRAWIGSGVKIHFKLRPGTIYILFPSPILFTTGVCASVYSFSPFWVELQRLTVLTLIDTVNRASVPHPLKVVAFWHYKLKFSFQEIKPLSPWSQPRGMSHNKWVSQPLSIASLWLLARINYKE